MLTTLSRYIVYRDNFNTTYRDITFSIIAQSYYRPALIRTYVHKHYVDMHTYTPLCIMFTVYSIISEVLII